GGETVAPGQGLETGSGLSRLHLLYPDGTRVTLSSNTILKGLEDGAGGKRVSIDGGATTATVTRQPAGRPMLFKTPHGEAKVLGTTLRITVAPHAKDGTRLDVDQGKVELKNLAGKTVLVESGHYA